MKQVLYIPIKPFSVNAMFCRNRSYKTKEFKEWSYKVINFLSLDRNQKKIDAMREHFAPKSHQISVDMVSFYPKEIMITKRGTISSKSMDLTNVEKPIVDIIFGKEYHGEEVPYKFRNLDINDKHITDLRSQKVISKDNEFGMLISIEIKDLDPLLSPQDPQSLYQFLT